MNVLAFDIETIPDTDAGRKIHELEDLSDAEVASVMFSKRREKVGHEFLATHLQKVVFLRYTEIFIKINFRFGLWAVKKALNKR